MSRAPAVHVETSSYWSSSAFPQFPKLTSDQRADVVVVGGGITGLTSAYLLATAGKRVVLLERQRCAKVDTGHTSAHLTVVTDSRLRELVRVFGRTHAQAVWDAGFAAIAQIDEIVRRHDIACEFAWVDGYLHAPVDDNTQAHEKELREDAELAKELGFDVEFIDSVPIAGTPGLRAEGQVRMHPRKYLAGLSHVIIAAGGQIYEMSEAAEFTEKPRAVKANGHTVRCEDVVIATHNPQPGFGSFAGATLFQTKLALYTSYVIAGRAPKGEIPDALWWDTARPYRYLRIEPQRDHDLVVFGGEDHKTGQETDADMRFERLESQLASMVSGVEITHRWSGQVIETPDGLPYIGMSADHQYTATGFAGNGLTFGTLGGMMMADAILGRVNPWTDLFSPGRKALGRGLWEYIKENADYPYYMIRDRFAGTESHSLRAVPRGEGQIIERNGEKVAAYRDASGAVTMSSAVCTHMGCLVAWNDAERTWDCPCHGSRFKTTGEVIAGPAGSPLPPVNDQISK